MKRAWFYPLAFEKEYAGQLQRIAKAFALAIEANEDKIKKAVRPEDVILLMLSLRNSYMQNIPGAFVTALTAHVFRLIDSYNRRKLSELLGATTIHPPDGPWHSNLQALWLTLNRERIDSTVTMFWGQIEGAALRLVLAGYPPDKRYAEMKDIPDKVSNRMNFIALDETGNLNAALSKQRQTALGITQYTWRTMLDNRVRPKHAAREGRVFSWNDPPEGGHPGEDFACRCFAQPLLDKGVIIPWFLPTNGNGLILGRVSKQT